MNAKGLPARIAYAIAAVPAAGAAGFYAGVVLLPQLARLPGDLNFRMDGRQTFAACIAIGMLLAFTASLLALTLPWRRHRKRRGRPMRAIISTVIVFVAALIFTQQGHALLLDLALVLWLAYALTYTFVRYGVLDQPRRTANPADAASPHDTTV
ncbi:MAG: hypothetical protein ABR910_09820 [Acidobacteriaceae bacterium]|jgi:hypothetical protein